MKIEHKDIPKYENIYQATTSGDIYALPRSWVTHRNGIRSHNGMFLSKIKNRLGYLMVKLTNADGLRKTCTVHRLVALTFIPNPENKSDVNHINGDKADNRVENLEWATRKENAIHSHSTGLGNISIAQDTIKKKVRDKKTGFVFDSIVDAAASLGIKRKNLSLMLNGEWANKTNMEFYDTTNKKKRFSYLL
jgi:hypothetical protein